MISFATLVALVVITSSANATIISYWNENRPAFGDGTFGYPAGFFPEAASVGNGTLNLANFDATVGGANNSYQSISNFTGTTTNAQNGDPAGGALSPTGGVTGGSTVTNNGMSILLNVSTVGYAGINLSWAQRGTATGFNSRAFDYSTNGGGTFTPVAYAGDSGALTSTFTLASPNLTGITALENNPNVVFRLTLNGATSASGNNRFDNILVQGIQVPEPASLALFGIVGLAAISRRRSR